MAEYVMKNLVEKAGLEREFHIESAATSTEEIGNPVYPPARRKLAEHGIDCAGHTARQLRQDDYRSYDLLIGMDCANLRGMRRIISAPRASLRSVALRNNPGGCSYSDDPAEKLHLLLDYTDRPGREVADPWYTGDFDATWRDVNDGCRGLLRRLGFAP